MSDLISRQALIEEINNQLREIADESCAYKKTLFIAEKVKHLIDRQPTVEVQQWIPCSERLPKYSDVYQITRKVFEGKCAFYIADCAYFDGQNTWHSDNRVNHEREYLKDVIAWCPLQSSYKGE